MKNLDDVATIRKLDTLNVLGSIELLGGQCKQAWEEVQLIKFPLAYRSIQNIVFSGMGGSALGAYVVKSLYSDALPVPFEIVNDYRLPKFVNDKTLVILASYSGTTEETISSAEDALQRKAKTIVLTTGGKLADIARQSKIPAYIFVPRSNPSNQPRLGTGYSVFGQIAILNALGLLSVSKEEASEVISILDVGNKKYGLAVATRQNEAKQLAEELYEMIPVIVTAEFLTHVGRVIRNQIHESAKSFAAYHEIPELNHHLMEGLTNPKINKDILKFVFISSPNYTERIKKRFEVTRRVVEKQGISLFEFVPQAKGKLAQAFECIQFGAYTNFYMAMLYGLDPSKIPWVDYFKAELAKA